MLKVNSINFYNANKETSAPKIVFRGNYASEPDNIELCDKWQLKDKTLQRLKSLKGPSALNTDKIAEILLQDRGIDPKLVTPKNKTGRYLKDVLKGQNSSVCEFNFISGDLSITKNLAFYMSNGQYAAVIAHELDHLINGAKLCKYLGVDEYEKLVRTDKSDARFNKKFWQKASAQVDIKNFNPQPIKKNIEDLLNPKLRFGYSGGIETTYEYLTSPLEKSAYDLQYRIEDILGEKPSFINHRGETELIENLNKAFNEAAKRNPNIADFKNELIDMLYEDSLRFIHKPLQTANEAIEQKQLQGVPIDNKSIALYNREIKRALLKMNSTTLGNIFNPQKCMDREKVIFDRMKFMFENAPLENYLLISSTKRLKTLQNIQQTKSGTFNAEQKRLLKDEIGALQAKIESLQNNYQPL